MLAQIPFTYFRSPRSHQSASDFDPTSHANFGAATHPGVGSGTQRRLAALDQLSEGGGCSFVWSFMVLFLSCVCDLFVFEPNPGLLMWSRNAYGSKSAVVPWGQCPSIDSPVNPNPKPCIRPTPCAPTRLAVRGVPKGALRTPSTLQAPLWGRLIACRVLFGRAPDVRAVFLQINETAVTLVDPVIE